MQLVMINRLGLSGRRRYDPAALAWVDSVFGNGGIVTGGELRVIDRFVRTDRDWGIFDLTDDYLFMSLGNVIAAKTTLKRRVLIQTLNNLNFETYRGFVTDGMSQCLNSMYAPFQGVALTATSQRFGVFNLSAGVGAHGGRGASGNRHYLSLGAGPPATAGMYLGNGITLTANVPNTDGFVVGSFDSVSRAVYRNGALVQSGAGGVGIKTVAYLYIGAILVGTDPASFVAGTFPFATFGGAISAAQEAAQFSNLTQAFAALAALGGA